MNSEIAHAGAWGIAAIMIVIVSWMFYRYFAPKTWREWASAGVVQAFIIALYAEMSLGRRRAGRHDKRGILRSRGASFF